MNLVEWTPVKKSEKQAIAQHGTIWRELRAPWTPTLSVMQANPVMAAQPRLITSPDGADLRWIGGSQVTEEVIDETDDPAESDRESE